MENGYYYTVTRIKESALGTIDNVTKFAYYDEDYETVEEWHEYTEEEIAEHEAQEAEALKKEEREAFLDEAPARVDGIESSILALISAFATEVE